MYKDNYDKLSKRKDFRTFTKYISTCFWARNAHVSLDNLLHTNHEYSTNLNYTYQYIVIAINIQINR